MFSATQESCPLLSDDALERVALPSAHSPGISPQADRLGISGSWRLTLVPRRLQIQIGWVILEWIMYLAALPSQPSSAEYG